MSLRTTAGHEIAERTGLQRKTYHEEYFRARGSQETLAYVTGLLGKVASLVTGKAAMQRDKMLKKYKCDLGVDKDALDRAAEDSKFGERPYGKNRIWNTNGTAYS